MILAGKSGIVLLKLVAFIYIAIITIFRIADGIYIAVTAGETSLPVVVIVLTAILALLGIYMILRKVAGKLKLREVVLFFFVNAVVIGFDLFYIAATLPLELTSAEGLLVGSVLDIIISLVFLYYSWKEDIKQYKAVNTQMFDDKGDMDD